MPAWFLAAAPEAAGVLFDRPESLAAVPGSEGERLGDWL
jgi:hypothetical protein